MKIAVTSQNRKTITGHAGKCRKFWLYKVGQQQVLGKQVLQLPLARTGIVAVVTPETDPDLAVAAWLNGNLAETSPHAPRSPSV